MLADLSDYTRNQNVRSVVISKFYHSLGFDDISDDDKQITPNYLSLHIYSGIIQAYF